MRVRDLRPLCTTSGRMLAGLILPLALAGGSATSAQRTTSYTYDALGRLTSSTEPGSTARYTHDAAGNRSRVTVSTGGPTVLNASFEEPQVGSYVYAPSAPDVLFSGGAGIAANGSAWGFPTPWHLNQVAFVQANNNSSSWLQMKAIRLVVGKTYRIAFAASRRPGFPENSLRVLIDGSLVWDAAPATADRFTANVTATFVATASTAAIRFESSPTPYDSSSGIDAVSVQQLD